MITLYYYAKILINISCKATRKQTSIYIGLTCKLYISYQKKYILINFFDVGQVRTQNLLLEDKKFSHINLKQYHKIQDVMKA